MAAAVLLAALLTYRAHAATRTHREAIEQALGDYAAVGAWRLRANTQGELSQTMLATAMPVLSRLMREGGDADALALARQLDGTRAPCRCIGDSPLAFGWSASEGWRFHGDGAARAALAPRLEAGVLAHARGGTLQPFRTPVALATGEPDRPRGARRWESYSFGLTSLAAGASPVLVMYVAERDAAGALALLFGFVHEASPMLRTIVQRQLEGGRLMPRSVVDSTDAAELLAVRVLRPDGRPLYRSDPGTPTTFAARDTLPASLGSLVLELGLDPRLVERLVRGGVPRSRLAELLAMLALLVATVVVLFVQMRRQSELSELRAGFVAGVSHELRTPLTQIRMLAEFLQMEREVAPERLRRSLRIIDQEARRLSFLVENVLAYGRTERRDVQVAPEPLTLATEVEELLELFAPLARAQRVVVRSEVPAGLQVHADRAALRQVLINLLDNAVRYGPDGQTVVVSTHAEPAGVRIMVDDEGPGVPEAERERVFEPYARLTRDRRSARGGSGIGLSVVRGLVAAHGGAVSIGTSPAGGARVAVWLPARSRAGARPAPHPAAPASTSPAGGATV